MAGTNPILDELSGLSPEAQQALRGAHAAAALAPQPPPVDQGLQAPSRIPKAPQMGAPPPTATPQMPNPTPTLSAPAAPSVTPPRGTLQGDINERGRREAEGPGITNIHSKIEGALPNHPTLGKALGYAAEVPLRGLEAVGSTLSPGIASLTPGTQLNFAREMRNLNSNIGKESEEQLKGAQTGEAQARTGLTTAQTAAVPENEKRQREQLDAQLAEHGLAMSPEGQITPVSEEQLSPEIRARLQGQWKPVAGVAGPNGEPMEYNAISGTYRAAPGAAGSSVVATDKMAQGSDFNQFLKDWLASNKAEDTPRNRIKAREAWAAASQAPQRAPQVMVMIPNAQGGSTAEVLRPGQSVEPGAMTPQQMGSATAKDQAAATSAGHALQYANTYLASGKFTGPADEALQDQFFELAKPSTGFRMNQSQIDQLHRMQSWVNSIEGAAYHAKNGTWFSPEQRQQIVETMNALGKAKGVKGSQGGGQEGGGGTPKEGDEKTNSSGDHIVYRGGKWQPK